MEKTGKGLARGTKRTRYRPRRKVQFVNFGKIFCMVMNFRLMWTAIISPQDNTSGGILLRTLLTNIRFVKANQVSSEFIKGV
jgi:hypothetical protein